MNRRSLLAGLSAAVVGTAGCLGRSGFGGSTDPTTDTEATPTTSDTDPTTDQSETKQKKETDEENASALTDWERSTDCGKKHGSMHDSVVTVAAVRASVGDGYAPIRFSDLSTAEKDILRPVTEEGGYGTYEAGDAFGRFVQRMRDHQEKQDERRHVFLERDGTYYRLYVEVSDQVYVY
jgi:hypothetical protein